VFLCTMKLMLIHLPGLYLAPESDQTPMMYWIDILNHVPWQYRHIISPIGRSLSLRERNEEGTEDATVSRGLQRCAGIYAVASLDMPNKCVTKFPLM
jgi:hypothetical protein